MKKVILSLAAILAASLWSFGIIQWPLMVFIVAVIVYLQFSKNVVLKTPLISVFELPATSPDFKGSNYMLGTVRSIPFEKLEEANDYRDTMFTSAQLTRGFPLDYTNTDLVYANKEAINRFSAPVLGLYIKYEVGFQFIPKEKLNASQKSIYDILVSKHNDSFLKNT